MATLIDHGLERQTGPELAAQLGFLAAENAVRQSKVPSSLSTIVQNLLQRARARQEAEHKLRANDFISA